VEPSFLLAQSLSGLTAAMFLFIVASGLSLIFGVLRVLNFAHGSFYMLGAYAAWQVTQWLGAVSGNFWLAVLGAAVAVALLGGVIERLLLRHLYGREELYQLLFTYALVLILGDLASVELEDGGLLDHRRVDDEALHGIRSVGGGDERADDALLVAHPSGDFRGS